MIVYFPYLPKGRALPAEDRQDQARRFAQKASRPGVALMRTPRAQAQFRRSRPKMAGLEWPSAEGTRKTVRDVRWRPRPEQGHCPAGHPHGAASALRPRREAAGRARLPAGGRHSAKGCLVCRRKEEDMTEHAGIIGLGVDSSVPRSSWTPPACHSTLRRRLPRR